MCSVNLNTPQSAGCRRATSLCVIPRACYVSVMSMGHTDSLGQRAGPCGAQSRAGWGAGQALGEHLLKGETFLKGLQGQISDKADI